jgi:2,4'-dihydroxyacetophenone dioxygenase
LAQNGKPRAAKAIHIAVTRRAERSGDMLREDDNVLNRQFDDRNIRWYTLEGFDNLAYHICEVDERLRTVDILFKFAANKKIALHRHKAPYRTLVLQGELRIYRANGELKEVRPIGSYVSAASDGEPHTEGGGDIDVIAFFSNRGVDGPVYEILDDGLNVVATLGIAEFKGLLDAQRQSEKAA